MEIITVGLFIAVMGMAVRRRGNQQNIADFMAQGN